MAARSFMHCTLTARHHAIEAATRTFIPEDEIRLGVLMYRAYRDTVDYEGETPVETAAEVRKTIQGEYGFFMPQYSKVLERDNRLLSAVLITKFQNRPFVAFTFTDPEFTGQGLARACMRSAMAELCARGESELRLVVTLANAPAVKLYTNLGFEREH